eukprot:6209724-Pleurochrysis_carterae.AAC.3
MGTLPLFPSLAIQPLHAIPTSAAATPNGNCPPRPCFALPLDRPSRNTFASPASPQEPLARGYVSNSGTAWMCACALKYGTLHAYASLHAALAHHSLISGVRDATQAFQTS